MLCLSSYDNLSLQIGRNNVFRAHKAIFILSMLYWKDGIWNKYQVFSSCMVQVVASKHKCVFSVLYITAFECNY